MPEKPHIFISHANGRNNNYERTLEICECLYDSLDASGWDVFLDKERLNPGDLWRPQILNKLAAARAGIILFDKTAIEDSDWVKAEALIMCFRKAVDPTFQIIPVFLDGLTIENQRFSPYKPFQLSEITYTKDDICKTADVISKEIVSNLNLDQARAGSSFQGWMYKFEGLLFNLNRATLYESWRSLVDETFTNAVNENEADLRRALVQLIHHSPPLQTIPAVERLGSQLTNEQLEKTSKMIEVKWVENESVEIFFTLARNSKSKLMLIYPVPVGTSAPEVAECLISRLRYECTAEYTSLHYVSVEEGAGDTDESIVFHIEEVIKKRLGGTNPESAAAKIAIERSLNNTKTPIICFIPRAYAKTSVLAELQARFSTVIFLVHIDSNEASADLESSGGRVLTPLLDNEKIADLIDLRQQLELVCR